MSKQGLDPSNIKDLEIFSGEPSSSENKLSLISCSRVTGLCTNALGDTWQERARALTLNHGDSLPLAVHGVPILESP